MDKHCVICGREIPDGHQSCPVCAGTVSEEMRLILAETKAKTQQEKDIIHLKLIALSIQPYSRWWRWGYIGSLRRAIKALEKRG